MFAITPRGVGERVGARRIEPDWPLATGETFTVEDDAFQVGMVLAEDETSLRLPTPAEIDAAAHADAVREIQDAATRDIASMMSSWQQRHRLAEGLAGLVDLLEAKGVLTAADVAAEPIASLRTEWAALKARRDQAAADIAAL